jgi:hypothetical protein
MQKSKLMAVGMLVCALSGFGLGMLDVQAALLPNNPNTVEIVPDLAVYSPEPEAATPAQPAEPEPVKLYTEADVEMLARLIYTEARGVKSKTEQAAVVWVVLNRLDNPNRLQKTIAEVICAPYQFDYRPWAPVTDEFKALAADVLERWQAERDGQADVGRVLPPEYQYFEGRGGRNWFSAKWKSGEFWGWGLASPYED